MTRKNTLKSLPTDTEFRVVGLDLAKSDVSVAAIPVDDNTPSLVDRMTYADLLDWAGKISPTLFAMEPCNGYSLLCLQLENLGHEIKVISGWTVSMWINTHLSGQKTDLNDAIALARLAVSDAELTPIRHKSITEIRIQTVQAVRQQLMSQRSKSIVSFKALAQQWGIPCAAGQMFIYNECVLEQRFFDCLSRLIAETERHKQPIRNECRITRPKLAQIAPLPDPAQTKPSLVIRPPKGM